MVKLEELTDQQVQAEIEKNGIKVRRSQADKPDALRKVRPVFLRLKHAIKTRELSLVLSSSLLIDQ